MQPQFRRLDVGRTFPLAENVSGRPLFGQGASLNWADMAAGSTVAEHSHPHEQLGIVVRGRICFVVDGVEHELGPGDAYAIPGGVPHAASVGDEPAVMLDVFVPLREEHRASFGTED